MHDITSTLPVDVAPSARFTQNGRPMSIAGGRQEWFGYYWLWLKHIIFNIGRRKIAIASDAEMRWCCGFNSVVRTTASGGMLLQCCTGAGVRGGGRQR